MADRLTEFELVYDMSDTTAIQDAEPWCQNQKFFNDEELLKNQVRKSSWMTLEHNFCSLDGTQLEFPEDTSNIPFFSNISTINGEFLTMTVLGILFSQVHSSFAFTINFMDDYPLKIKCTWYRNNVVIQDREFDVDSREYVVRMAVQNYDRIDIEFLQTIPRRYVKVSSIRFGIIINWNEKNLKTGNVTLEIDPTSNTLPENQLTFEVIDDLDETNVGNREGLHNYFQRNQFMEAYENYNGERVYIGKYYLKEFSYNKNVCKITATSILQKLEYAPFKSADIAVTSTTPSPTDYRTVSWWVAHIMNDAGISNYVLEGNVGDKPIYFGIQPCDNCKQALQQILFAANLIVNVLDFTPQSTAYETTTPDIVIKEKTSVVSSIIPKSEKFNTTVKRTEYVSGVRVNYSVVNWKATDENNEVIVEDTFDRGVYYFDLDQPRAKFTINSLGQHGIYTATAYRIKLQIYDDSTYVKIQSDYIGEWEQKSVQVDREEDTTEWTNVKLFNTTLCDEDSARELAKNLLEYYTNRLEIDIKALVTPVEIIDGIKQISIDEKRIIQNSSTGMDDYIGRYTQRNIDLVKGFIDNAKLIGAFDLANAEYFARTENIELYTDDNEVI